MRDDASAAAAIGLAPGDVLWAAGSLCNLQRVPFDAAAAAHAFPPPHTLDTLIDVLRQSGLSARVVHCPARAIASLPMPCVALLAPLAGAPDTPTGQALPGGAAPLRPALVVRAGGERVLHFLPGSNAPVTAPLAAFGSDYRGIVLVAERTASLPADPDALPARRFGFHWFVPELLRHRRVWRDVIAASLALQLVALALPLLSQVIIDKVIVHRATSTLAVIAAALLLAVTFSAALGWIRQYLVLHTGNRVDAVLGSAVFRHLLALPLAYFEHRPTGVLTARLAGIETIREFVAGAAITLALDLPFLAVFLAVMFVYSVPLTLVTLAVVAVLVGLSIAVAPALQRRLNDQFLAGARNQAFVTEHLAGIETVKALQLEPQLVRRYEGNLAQALATAFRTRQLGNTYQSLAGALEQLLSITILCLGAWLAMTSAEFTIGMLVAFQMFAARVAQPLLRLAGLWQQFQQAAIAVRRLGDVMDVPAEPAALAATRSRAGPGRIELAGVGFRYGEGRPWLYRGLDLGIAPGECVVITGPSGCGKSTLFKLLLGFAAPVEGAIRIDGRDTRMLTPAEQRARFGVVPQETTLFSGSILDNLQLGNPLASVDQIVQACRLADIHATLEALPDGYRSPVGERGVGLSGGQKQRLALARALLRRPQALLLDEPFSQLDDDAARRIAAAVSRLKGALTILIVSHTLPPTLAYDRRIELGAAVGGNHTAASGRAG